MKLRCTCYAAAFLLSGCSIHYAQFSSYHKVKARSKALTEEGITSLYRDSTFRTNYQALQPIVSREAKRRGGNVVGDTRFIANGYFLDYRNNKKYILYNPETSTFYGFDLCNCGGPVSSSQGLIGPNCDLRITSISVLQNDSVIHEVDWKDAGPALADFRRNALPLIRRRVTQLTR